MLKSKVLVVEDEMAAAEIMKITLENLDYEVTGMATSVDSFHQCIQTILPDIVLMDIYLHGKPEGIELAKETYQKYNLPVVFITGFADKKILEKAMVTEPYGYLLKPINNRELHSTIEMALHRHQSAKKINHLNSVLRAIREISQLIVRAEDVTELIQNACETLISTRGYLNSWITLLNDDGNFSGFASAGLTGDIVRLNSEMKQGLWPDCIRCLETGIETYQIRHSKADCGDCPLKEAYPLHDILTARIRYKDKHLGYITVTTASSLLNNPEELALLNEITEDLGLAISNLDRLKKKEKAEQEIIHSRNDWEKTFDAIPDLIAIIDTDHRILRANKAMTLKLNCFSEDAIGCHCYEIVHGLIEIPEFCPHARSLHSGKEENSEVFEHRLNGTFDVTTTPIFDDDGKVTGCVHVARNVTTRKKKEQLMTETLALSEFALNHPLNELLTLTIDKAELLTESQIGFFHFLDDDEKTISLQAWSTNTLRSLCTTAVNGQHYPIESAGVWVDCLRDRRPVIHNDYESLSHIKGLPEGHIAVKRELTIPLFRGEKIVAIMGVGNKPVDYNEDDIEILTQLNSLAYEYIVSKRFEESLYKSEQHARALLNAIPDMIFRMDSNGVYLDYKGSTEDLHYQAESIIGKNNRDMTPPDFAELIESKIRSTLDHGQMELFEYQLMVPAKGLRDFEARMVPSGNDEVIAISRDITEHKKADETLRKKIEELQYFNHLMIDRELKMIELKMEINLLANKLGEEDRYVIHHKKDKQ